MRVQFIIPGKPYAWKRPRFNRKTGATFNDGAQESYYSTVASIAMRHLNQPMDGPVGMTVTAVFAMPISWSKKKRAALMGRPHTQTPDLSNIVKAVEDAGNRVLFLDDKQICAGAQTKVWGLENKTTVIVESL